MIDDPLANACAIVTAYLERSMVPDPEGAAAFVSPELQITFTGGRQFTVPAQTAAFNAKRYTWVKKRPLRMDPVLDPETGEVRVYSTGQLYGAWPDGTPFDGNRYMDTFVLRDGLIVETHVWNDSAEWLLEHAGLAEAPL
jgi:hypothetical protein